MNQRVLLKLEKIGLVGCQFRVGQAEIDLTDIDIDLEINIFVEEESPGEIKVFLDLILGDPSSESPSQFPFDSRIVYAGDFLLNKADLADEELKKIGAINGAAILYPYLRNFVSHLVLESLQVPFLLPPVNFVQYYKDNSEKIRFKKIRLIKESNKKAKRGRRKKSQNMEEGDINGMGKY